MIWIMVFCVVCAAWEPAKCVGGTCAKKTNSMLQNGSTSTTVNALIGAATNAPVADPAGPSATGPPETSILQSDDDASIATGISETSDDDASIATDISETSNTAVLGEEQVCKKNQNGGEYIVGTAPFCNAGTHSC